MATDVIWLTSKKTDNKTNDEREVTIMKDVLCDDAVADEKGIDIGELPFSEEIVNLENCDGTDENYTDLKNDNRGIGVVEIVLILVVLVALVIIFKDKIMDIVNSAFESITGGANSL